MTMGVIIKDSNLVIIKESKIILFNLPKDADNSLKYETGFIIKHNKFLAKHIIKNKISQLLSKYKHRNGIHDHIKQ